MLLLASSVCGLIKWRQFEPEVILLAVGWYLRFSLSYRDVEELLAERGLWSTTLPSGGGGSVTPRKGNDVCARGSNRPRQLARRRDLHPGQGQVALPVSCGGFFRRDPRLSPLGQAGRGRSKALPGQSGGTAEPSRAARHQHRRSQRDFLRKKEGARRFVFNITSQSSTAASAAG